jgi:hypothetical protein
MRMLKENNVNKKGQMKMREKEMNMSGITNKKSIAAVGIATATVTVMVSAFSVMPAFAMQRSSSGGSSLPAYKSAYKKVIKNHYKADSECGAPRYKLVNIDNDGTPELVVSPHDQILRVYSYKNGKLHKVLDRLVMMDAQLNWLYLPGKNRLCSREVSDYSYEHPEHLRYIDEHFYSMNASHTKLVSKGTRKMIRAGKETLKKRGYRGLTCIQVTDNGDIRTGKTYRQIMKQLSR